MKRLLSECQNFSLYLFFQVPVPTGLVTPGVPIKTVIPSPPKKKRRLAIDRILQLDADVIRRNVNTEGRETLRERVRNKHVMSLFSVLM